MLQPKAILLRVPSTSAVAAAVLRCRCPLVQRRLASAAPSHFATKAPVQPLPPFIDERYPPPEPRVSASLLPSALDLSRLRRRMQELECPTGLWQEQRTERHAREAVLLSGSSAGLGQQLCSAVFLSDGCVVCWHMSRETERFVLGLAASCPAVRRKPTRLGCLELNLEGPRQSAEECTPLAVEELEVTSEAAHEDVTVTIFDKKEGRLRLTGHPEKVIPHQLGLSLALAAAVRLDALEGRIEQQLENDPMRNVHEHLRGFMKDLSSVSHDIFVAENVIHELRYALNSEAGLLDPPDLLWEHADAEQLYDKVIAHFDVRRRTALLNERLSYSLEYLHTLAEHVRHLYSVRLERIIVILIALEILVGITGFMIPAGLRDSLTRMFDGRA